MQQQYSEKSDAFSYLSGFLGALLGAAVGAVPWFLVSTFLELYSSWLGLVVGICAFFGYKLLKGAKNKGYAITVIIICSVLMIYVSEFCSYWVVLSRDPEWIAAAEAESASVGSYVFWSLVYPDNLLEILKASAIGMILGVVGVCCMLKNVIQYCSAVTLQTAQPGQGCGTDQYSANPYGANPYGTDAASGDSSDGSIYTAVPETPQTDDGASAAYAAPAAEAQTGNAESGGDDAAQGGR